MKITNLEIGGYGVWTGLKLQRLTDGLNVVYGPNEAGKSTLLQFVRSVLYGFNAERLRYVPPIHGGRAGGSMEVFGSHGRCNIVRHAPLDERPGPGEIIVTTADGTRQGDQVLRGLLANLDEPTFNNVFAISLHEIQELNTLSDTQAADLLYSITAGLDRVSLTEVARELEASRNRILDRHGAPCQIAQMLDQREQLRRQIDDHHGQTLTYARLASDRKQLDHDLARLDEEKLEHLKQLSVRELAVGLRDRWKRHRAIGDELSAQGTPAAVPPDAVEKLEAIKQRGRAHEDRIENMHRRGQTLRHEANRLPVNEALGRHGGRIEATLEQDPWLRALESQIADLERQREELHGSMLEEYERAGLGKVSRTDRLPKFSHGDLARLRAPARNLIAATNRSKQHRNEASTAKETASSMGQQVAQALTSRNASDLSAAMERAGNLVNLLRRRIQIDERLEQMARNEKELQEQVHGFMQNQIPPLNTVYALAGIFVVGAVLLGIQIMYPTITGHNGWVLIPLGIGVLVLAVLGRYWLQRTNDDQLDACQNQLQLLQKQIRQSSDERASLDAHLPRGGGPMVSRLAAAEKELASLEDLAPLDTQHASAQQQATATAHRAGQTEEELSAARRAWRAGLDQAGLPPHFRPRHVKQVMRVASRVRDMQSRLARMEEELGQRRRERDMLHGRVAQLVADCGIDTHAKHPMEKVLELSEAYARQQNDLARREKIRRHLKKLHHYRGKADAAIEKLKRRRLHLLRQAGAESEEHLHRIVADAARIENLKHEHETLGHEIHNALGEQHPIDLIRQHLEGPAAANLDASRNDARTRLAALEKETHQRHEKRGQLAAQMKALTDDRQMAGKQLDLAALEKRIEDAIGRWQVLAVTAKMLESIRASYETDRQPETLQEASRYLSEMTQGRYPRVWTPVGERILRVNDAEGRSLPVEVLSRGTREQLFLSLRLALAAFYARRGAPLPLVLDDVLVNFDMERAKAAASVLRDFGAAGHQLLVFTCHEHIAKLFRTLRVPVNDLPDNSQRDHAPLVFDEEPRERTEKPKKAPRPASLPRRPPSRPRLAEVEESPYVEEMVKPAVEVLEAPAPEELPWEPEKRQQEEAFDDTADVWEEE